MAVELWESATGRKVVFCHAIDAKEAMATGKYLHEEPRPQPAPEAKVEETKVEEVVVEKPEEEKIVHIRLSRDGF
jgi:hypothetical protein